jgi:glycosyltransferase involved in cell wall biosynthesis
VPVISANVPGLRDSVKDGVSGLLYEYGNISELTERIISLLIDDDFREKLSLGAIE